jgi:DNA-directed RNA polymerase subunit K/omega
VSARVAVPHPLVQDSSDNETKGNRFLLAAVAFQRSKQLRGGATCRIEQNGHKSTYLAVLEVLANTISWSQVAAPERRAL